MKRPKGFTSPKLASIPGPASEFSTTSTPPTVWEDRGGETLVPGFEDEIGAGTQGDTAAGSVGSRRENPRADPLCDVDRSQATPPAPP